MSRYDQPQLLSAYQKALRPIDGVRQNTKQALTREQHQRAKQARLLLRGSAEGLLTNWWGEAPLSGAERARLAAMPPSGQDIVCRMLASRLAAQQPASPGQLARLGAIAAACSAESKAAAFLRLICSGGGILAAVLPAAIEAVQQRLSFGSIAFAAGYTPQLQRFVVAAIADALHGRGFRAGDLAWMTEQVEWVQAELVAEAPVRPHVLSGLRMFRAQLMGRPPSGTSASGIELLRLRRALNDILDLLPQDGPEPTRALVEQFEQALSKSVGEALERATKSLFQAAGGFLSMGSRVPIFGGYLSDAERAKQRLAWLREHVGSAQDFVIWHPHRWLGGRQLANCPAGIVRAMMPNESYAGSALPLLIRADFARGCVVMSLEKQFGIAVEFCPWGANGRLPIHQHPSAVLQRRTTSRQFPLGWEAAATGALRSLLL
jgi:hypothetical protein